MSCLSAGSGNWGIAKTGRTAGYDGAAQQRCGTSPASLQMFSQEIWLFYVI